MIAVRRVRSAEIVAIDGDHNAKFSSHHRNANHDLWLVWVDFDCRVDGKCRYGVQTPHPTPQNVHERKSSECQCLSPGSPECICWRSERLWHDQSLAAVGYAARRLAPERKRQLTPRKIFGAGRLAAGAADCAEFISGVRICATRWLIDHPALTAGFLCPDKTAPWHR